MNFEGDKDGGFSLLEVLVAFVVLSVALVAANQSISYSVRSFSSAKMARAADRIAEEVFAEQLTLSGASSEGMGPASNGLNWRLKREPFSLGVGNSDITAEKLTLEVTSHADGRIVRRYVSYGFVQANEADNAP